MREALREFATGKTTPETLDRLLSCCRYVRGDFDDPSTYERLKAELADAEPKAGTRDNCLFYLATPPELFAHVARRARQIGTGARAGRRLAAADHRKAVRLRSANRRRR